MDDEVRGILVSGAERMFSELCTKDIINGVEADVWPADLWRAADENGFLKAGLPEELGGAGLSLSDALLLARTLGRFAVPLPIGETMIGGWLLAQAGLAVANGPLGIGPATPNTSLRLTGTQDGWALNGALRGMPWGERLTRIVVVAFSDDRPFLASVDPAVATITHGKSLAGEQVTRFDFVDAPLAAADVAPLPQKFGADIILILGAALRTQQLAGACQAARDLAVRYAGDRIQFGQPLAKLPAVQQNLAVLAGHAAAAGVAADMAIDAVDRLFDEAARETAAMSIGMAKIRAGEAGGIVAGLAHQTHGAIGFTYEHTLHHPTRRIWAWRDEFGKEAYWSKRIGSHLVAAGDTAFWPLITECAQLSGAGHV